MNISAVGKYLRLFFYSKRGTLARPTLPFIVFLIAFSLTAILTKISHDAERKVKVQQANFDAKELTKNVELLLLNDTLRLQIHLENIDMSRVGAAKMNAPIVQQLLKTTVFQRATVFAEQKSSNKENQLARIVTFRTNDDLLPFDHRKSRYLMSPYVKHKVQLMKEKNQRTSYSISNYNNLNTLSLIWRSQYRRNEFTILTTPIQPLFDTGKDRTNLYAVLTDPEVNLSLMAYWDDRGQIQVTADKDRIINAEKDLLFLNQTPLITVNSSIKINWYMPQTQIYSMATLTTFFSGLIISALFSILLHFILAQNRRISQLVVSRTIDLERAMSDAQEANLAKTRFLANMSHELRTPLNIILGMTELIENKVRDAKTLEFISTMRSAGDHLLSLITDILSMSKEESIDINIKNAPINTIVFIEEIGRLIGPECRKNGLAFDIQVAQDLPAAVIGDPARVRQVLTNLLKNSIKYTREGFVSLRISKIIDRNAKEGFALFCFEVVDSGIGIPKEKKQEIFNRFFQLEGGKMLADGGVGLGLSIVKDLVGKMGGQITVQSEIRKGSTFTVQLDFEIKDARPWTEDLAYSSLNGKKVLIVENEVDTQFHERVQKMIDLPGVVTESCTFRDLNEMISRHNVNEYFKIIVSASSGFNFAFLDLNAMQGLHKFIFISNEERSAETELLSRYGKVVDNSPLLPTRLFSALDIQPRKRGKMKVAGSETPAEVAGESSPLETTSVPALDLNDPNLSILVADDDLTNQDLLRAYFDGKPWTTVFANNGLEAFEAYRKNQPDVVIADFRMPILDGFEMAKSIRDYEVNNKLKNIPIVIVTADALEETEKRALEISNTVFLTKPVRRARLLEAINSVSK